jgi:flavorubredoxin
MRIFKDLEQYSMMMPQANFTVHQYLLLSDAPVFFSTGSLAQTESIMPDIKKALGGKALKYFLLSHIDTDECGGLAAFVREFPDMTLVCGAFAAGELANYGYKGKVLVKNGGDELSDSGFSFTFVDYPAEAHLINGVLFCEKTRGIFYSSDLMIGPGDGRGKTIDAKWTALVDAINPKMGIPDAERCKKLQADLHKLAPSFVAVGHGFCVNCK